MKKPKYQIIPVEDISKQKDKLRGKKEKLSPIYDSELIALDYL